MSPTIYLIAGIIVILATVGLTIMIWKLAGFATLIELEARKNNKNIELAMLLLSIFALMVSISSIVLSVYQNDRLNVLDTRLKQIETRK